MSLEPSQSITTRFVQIQIEFDQATGPALRDLIEAQLQTHGQPLRWAITSVEGAMAHVEAVVTLFDNKQS
ncbi:MAG: hypothetical protein AAF821_14100 [Cyanobacteria bacterium P01_D01_bin.156]